MARCNVTNVIKWLFILTQVTFTLIFIWDAVDNWQTYPSVTSIDVANIDQELFPAVTVCYPNTWKWPGILKLLSNWVKSNKTMENTLFGINSKRVYIHYIHLHERFFELVWKRMYAVDRSQFNDTCTLINGTFKNLKGQKQGQFLLNMYVQMILNNDFVSEQEFYKNMDMSNRWQEGESLAFDDIKSDICQHEYLDCTNDDNECSNYFGYFDWNLWSSLNALWAFSTFWEPLTLLQMYLYKGMP